MINDAIFKYKMNEFILEILEYCEPDIIIEREQFYIDILQPEYNILKIAGSTIGRKLSEEAKINISIRNKGFNNPMYGKTHTEETKLILSIHNKGYNNPMYGKTHTEETKLRIKASLLKFNNTNIQNIDNHKKKTKILKNQIEILDSNNKSIQILDNGMKISKFYNIPKTVVYRYIQTGKLYKNSYYFRKVNNNRL